MFSILVSSTARSVHLDFRDSYYPVSLRAMHLDGPRLTDGADLQEAGDTQGHLPHSTSWPHTSR